MFYSLAQLLTFFYGKFTGTQWLKINLDQETVYAIGEVLISSIALVGSFIILAMTLVSNSPAASAILPIVSGLLMAVATLWFTGRIHSAEGKNARSLISAVAGNGLNPAIDTASVNQ